MIFEKNEKKFSESQEIVNELAIVWWKAEQIERSAIELLGDNNPICENLAYACVGIMNAYDEIKANLKKVKCNKLEPKTLAQIIDVLTRIKWTGAEYHKGIIQAYQDAVNGVAHFHQIHRNTIADACIRRIGLKYRNQFIDLTKSWLNNKPCELKEILKRHARSIDHSVIESFFHEKKKPLRKH